MWENRLNHTSNKDQETEVGWDLGGVLYSIYNCMEQQLFTVVMKQQSYDRIYVIWITRIGSTGPRVVCYWNTSEVKGRKVEIHYERENKENQSSNAI